MNIGIVSEAPLGKLLRDRVEHIIMGFSECIDNILTELNRFISCIVFLYNINNVA